MKKVLALVLTAILLTGSLAGCSNNNTSQTTPNNASTEEGGTSAEGETASAAGDGINGGTVTLCYADEPTTFFLPFSASTGDRASAAPALESLGRVDEFWRNDVLGFLS